MFFGRINSVKGKDEKLSPKYFCIGLFSYLILFNTYLVAQNFPSNKVLSSSILKVSAYVASPEFYKLRLDKGELAAIDSIYIKALSFSNSDKSEALLSLTFALLPFRTMDIRLPFFKNRLSLHLPTVNRDLFSRRTENLPRHFLPDSPDSFGSDTDKLSHFFGNAFISYNINFFKISEFLGIFVESFEKLFKVGGAFDKRDLETNELGVTYGILLDKGYEILPSSIFLIYSLRNIKTP